MKSPTEVRERFEQWGKRDSPTKVSIKVFREAVAMLGFSYDPRHPRGRAVTRGGWPFFDVLVPGDPQPVATVEVRCGLVCFRASELAVAAMLAYGG